MTLIDLLGWAAAFSTFAAFSMKTMLPLRIAAISANLLFITYGALSGLTPILVLHLTLLPFNVYRLLEIRRLTRQARATHAAPQALAWLRDAMLPVHFQAGAQVFRKGDTPDAFYYLDQGQIRLEEIGVDLSEGELFGEIAFFSHDRTRTLTATCLTPCRVLTLDEDGFTALYFKNPELGLTLVRLVTQRLLAGMKIAPQAYLPSQKAPDLAVVGFAEQPGTPYGPDKPQRT
jgi:hypothetical protein